ncbi:hypothetical protein BC936DRAFT_144321, partial [Jimgerdemannia flammicorona]
HYQEHDDSSDYPVIHGQDNEGYPAMVLRKRPSRVDYTIPDSPDAAVTDSSYIPSSPHSDATISKANNESCMDYFIGPGIIEWNLDDCLSRHVCFILSSIFQKQWMIGKNDISSKCCEYRMAIIKKCETMHAHLTALEELALSHVFIFQEENPYDLDGYFDDELWGTLFVEFRNLYPYIAISDDIVQMFANTVKVGIACENPNYPRRKAAIYSYLQSLQTTNNSELMREIIQNLVNNEQPSFIRSHNIEDTHIHSIVAPVLGPFFKNRRTIFEW